MTCAEQVEFATAVLDPARAVPAGLTDPQGRPAGKRFDVYRNNVVVSLMKALETAFPALARSLGPQNFQVLAATFVRRHPPGSPLMMHYGADLPDFLGSFAPLAPYPWLGDLARLELALRESYHAADAVALPQDRLTALTPDQLMASRPRLAPSARLIRSRWPVLSLWRGEAAGDRPGEAVLILRPDFDPVPHLLPAGGATFVTALLGGQTLGAASEAASAAIADFDLAQMLGLLLGHGALIDL